MSKREKDIIERTVGKRTAANEFTEGLNKETNKDIKEDSKKDSKKEIKSNNDNNNNELVNNEGNIETYEDIKNKFIKQKKEKPKKKQQVVYLDEGVAKDFDKWAKKHGKGAKSELIETLLKNFLKENG